ncbi:MAG: PKD domain-containing protein [Chitinophagaceae bacterium]|nr:MAG: PKD domain-containing protein [Chitinophagaceae bacterium]
MCSRDMDVNSGKTPEKWKFTPERQFRLEFKAVSFLPRMKFLIRGFILFLSVCGCLRGLAQTNTYIRNGAATQNTCNCYTLTPAMLDVSGSVWNASKIDLNTSFDFIFNVYLGCQDANGADGIVFMLQPISTSVGAAGGGLGFEGVVPSVGITLDTWQNENNNDPWFDHISIQTNGNLTHGVDLAGPVQASVSNSNIEDCQWHTFRIRWDAATTTLSAFFDGSLRVISTENIISSVFNNDPMVYWGFSAATGGAYNLQQFCTALNPLFTTGTPDNMACIGETISFTNSSESFAPIASYHWDLGDGNTYNVRDIPPHNYSAPGIYNVKMAITGFDGCNSDTLRRTVTIGDFPIADFSIADTCAGKAPRLRDLSAVNVGTISQWNWLLDGNPLPSAPNPDLGTLAPGTHDLSLSVTSSAGCASASQQQHTYEVFPVPEISGTADNGCVNRAIQFDAVQVDNATSISQWNWVFAPNQSASQASVSHVFTQPGTYNVSLSAQATNGCESDVTTIPVFINQAVAFAGNDTVVIKSEPFQLKGTGGGTYLWSPGTYMNNTAIAGPVVTPEDDITYNLTVTTPEGCEATDAITLTVFKGSEIFVPTAFTPNNDGINEKLGPYYVGIRNIGYFMVYNRWGQLVYSTRNKDGQWDGTINGIRQPAGVYVWRLAAVDYIGKQYEMKGTTTLVR